MLSDSRQWFITEDSPTSLWCYFDPGGLSPISPEIIYCFHQTPSLIYVGLCFSNGENVFFLFCFFLCFLCSVRVQKQTPVSLWVLSCLPQIYCGNIVCSQRSQFTCCVPVDGIFRSPVSHCGVDVESGIMARMCRDVPGQTVVGCLSRCWSEACLIVALWLWKNTELLD